MTTIPAIVALVATIALGVAVGLMYLHRTRNRLLVKAHLWMALAATALVALLLVLAPPGPREGPAGAWPLGLLVVAVAAGYFAWRIPRQTTGRAELMLGLHVAIGLAGFLVFLAWRKGL